MLIVKAMAKSRILIILGVTIIIIGTASWLFYYFTFSSSASFVVIRNTTVYGQASGIPCGAMHFPCITSPNQSTPAQLLLFQGKYYYDSNLTWNHVVYTIWYDNSTYYCISPKLEWANTCPP
ncbi:MAG: hypothetical protein OK439_07345 [Thaumarchaeota archaeon]|nr:hypothetical protein [Nitrososphaerota archaeon]